MVGLEDIMSTGLGPARKAAGLTQAQLGERINVHPPHIARWETGGVLPRVATTTHNATRPLARTSSMRVENNSPMHAIVRKAHWVDRC